MSDNLMEKVSAFGERLKIGGAEVGRKMSAGMSSMSFKVKELLQGPNQEDILQEKEPVCNGVLQPKNIHCKNWRRLRSIAIYSSSASIFSYPQDPSQRERRSASSGARHGSQLQVHNGPSSSHPQHRRSFPP